MRHWNRIHVDSNIAERIAACGTKPLLPLPGTSRQGLPAHHLPECSIQSPFATSACPQDLKAGHAHERRLL